MVRLERVCPQKRVSRPFYPPMYNVARGFSAVSSTVHLFLMHCLLGKRASVGRGISSPKGVKRTHFFFHARRSAAGRRHVRSPLITMRMEHPFLHPTSTAAHSFQTSLQLQTGQKRSGVVFSFVRSRRRLPIHSSAPGAPHEPQPTAPRAMPACATPACAMLACAMPCHHRLIARRIRTREACRPANTSPRTPSAARSPGP